MGCAGLMARLADAGARIHVVYLAVDGFHHYGIDGDTTYAQRVDGDRATSSRCSAPTRTYEIVYGDQDLIEKLDTLPRRELVDRFEKVLNEHKPELLLLPALPDYDQDHQAVFHAAHAAARPIAAQFGKWLTPQILAYEMTKLQWASEPLPRFGAFTDITEHWRPSSRRSAATRRCCGPRRTSARSSPSARWPRSAARRSA